MKSSEYKTWKDVPIDSLTKELVKDQISIHDGHSINNIIEYLHFWKADMNSAYISLEKENGYYDEVYIHGEVIFIRSETDTEFSQRCVQHQKKIFKESSPKYKEEQAAKKEQQQKVEYKRDLAEYKRLKKKLKLS